MTPDVNVLVAAFRGDHVVHKSARTWLTAAREDCARGTTTLCLLPVVVCGFLRIVTNSRAFPDPDPMDEAVAFVDGLLETPGVELRAGDNEWFLLRDKLLRQKVIVNLVTDSWIAASVELLAEHLVTFDRDFERLLPARDRTLLT